EIGDVRPCSSPDGTRIAFIAAPCSNSTQLDVWVMYSDGSGLTQLTSGILASGSAPTWSPDGTEVWFQAHVFGDDEILAVSTASPFNVRRITDSAGLDADPSFGHPTVYGVIALYDQTKAHRAGSTIPIKIELVNSVGKDVSSPNLGVHAVGLIKVSS